MTNQRNQPVARTRNGEITLDQLGEIQPGLARIMMEVSERYWILYYAAKAGNWKLAAHESGELKRRATEVEFSPRKTARTASIARFRNSRLLR